MKYTIKLRDGLTDTVTSGNKIDLHIEEGCIIIFDELVTLAIYPIKEVVKINKVVE